MKRYTGSNFDPFGYFSIIPPTCKCHICGFIFEMDLGWMFLFLLHFFNFSDACEHAAKTDGKATHKTGTLEAENAP